MNKKYLINNIFFSLNMSAKFDTEEIQMVLGIHKKENKLMEILNQHPSDGFLSAISNIIRNS